MKSILMIRWTEEATRNLENTILYLESHWSEKEIKSFFVRLEKQLELISLFPQAYPISSKYKNVHRCVFPKNLTIYYTIKDDFIVLLSFFDTRQHPKRIKL